jgi:hypothetical protein
MARQRLNRGFCLTAAALAIVALTPSAASAATITVNSPLDPTATPSDCTLHDAITAANTNATVAGSNCTAGSGASDIIDATGLAGQTITLAGGLPQITTTVNINGPGSGQLTISGNDLVRPFNTNSAAVVNITGLTITHGFALGGGGIMNAGTLTLTDVAVINNTAQETGGTNTFPEGGGIRTTGTLHLVLSTVSANVVNGFGGTSQNNPAGGGIWNNGTVTIDRSTLAGNGAAAVAGVGGATNASGAGIVNFGTLSLLRSTLSANEVSSMASGTSNSAVGGAIANANAPAVNVTIDRSTVTDNQASADSPGTAEAGGFTVNGTSFSVTSSTIAGNSAPSRANAALAAVATIKNTIISNPLGGGANCSGAATSQGFNLTDVAGCGFVDPTDQVAPPLLSFPLADHGGPTQTLLPQPNSPAIDKGLASGGETVDQRGLQRPWLFDIVDASGGDGTDIGAVEVQGPVPTGTTPTSPGASGSPNVFGTVESGSTVQLFNDGSCGTPATSGPAATFISPGLIGGPVAAGTSTTFSVRSTYGTATSVCSPTTIPYTNSTIPSPPSGDGTTPGTTPPTTTAPRKKKCKKRKHRAAAAKKKCKKRKR